MCCHNNIAVGQVGRQLTNWIKFRRRFASRWLTPYYLVRFWVRMSFARRETLPEDGTARGNKEYGKHAAKNIGVSIVRAGRELDLDDSWARGYEPTERWWGAEVEFPPPKMTHICIIHGEIAHILSL